MPFQAFLQPIHLLQTLVLALSIFNLIAYLWLAFTVWLNGNRSAWITRIGVAGLGLAALFFFLHALLISSPLSTSSSGLIPVDFWWHLIWIPAIGVPYIWFAIGLHYASLMNEHWRKRRPLLLIISGIPGALVLLLLVLNASTFTFVGTLRLLVYSDSFEDAAAGLFSPHVLLPLLFLCYVTLCAIGPWFTLGRIIRLLRVLLSYISGHFTHQADTQNIKLPLGRALVNAFWDDRADGRYFSGAEHPGSASLAGTQPLPRTLPVQERILSWQLARPVLLLAALLMVSLTTTLGVLVISSLVDWLQNPPHTPLPSTLPLLNEIPLNLILLDLSANGAVALIILLIGYSIVRQGILIERPLARRGFFEQWRGIVIVATTVALFIAFLVTLTHSNLGGLLLITSLATAAYALFTWSNYTAHDRYIALLGPFLRSTSLRHWLNTDLQKTEKDLENLFYHLCSDVLAVQCARLPILAGSVRRNFNYRWPENAKLEELPPSQLQIHRVQFEQVTPQGQPMICWVLPIYDERGLVATLYLGPRQDGAAFTHEDMNLAHACGQRILDTIGDHEAMQAVAGLLRRRTVDVKLLGAQQRRVLHDEILPQMHLALLHLETLRTLNRKHAPIVETVPPALDSLGSANSLTQFDTRSDTMESAEENILSEAIEKISDAHRRLAAMMRATTLSAPHRLERDGLVPAIHTMLEQDFQHAFDEVIWEVSDETAACIDELTPPAIAELIFAAVQEALRNAARHARGTDVHRRLRLLLKASCHPHLEVIVADDGIGIVSATSTTYSVGVPLVSEKSGRLLSLTSSYTQLEDARLPASPLPGTIQRSSTSGTGSGLRTHSALLAIAGGSLTVKSAPGEGVTVRIVLPAESLRYR